MIRTIVTVLAIAALSALGGAAPASAAAPNAACVGQFSSFFAHGGEGTHRSEVAQHYAHGARPAGANVYSHVADVHGSLQQCFDAFR